MTISVKTENQDFFNSEAMQKFSQQSDQQKLSDESSKKINEEKKKRPEDVAGLTGLNLNQIPLGDQKLIEAFSTITGIHSSLKEALEVGAYKIQTHEPETEATTSFADKSDSKPAVEINLQLDMQAQQPVTESPDFVQSIFSLNVQQKSINTIEARNLQSSESTNPSLSRSQGISAYAGTSWSSGMPSSGEYVSDVSGLDANMAKADRQQRIATMEKQFNDKEKIDESAQSGSMNMQQPAAPEVLISQPQQPQQGMPSQRQAEKTNPVVATESGHEGIKYNLKSWGGNQSVRVTGTAQQGYQARGSDSNVQRVLQRHASESLNVSVAAADSAADSSASEIKGVGLSASSEKSDE